MNTTTQTVNVSKAERLLSLIGGAFLLLDSVVNNKFRGVKLSTGGYLLYRGLSGNCVGYSLAGKPSWRDYTNINLRTNLIIERSPESLYRIWRKLENLPRFMSHLISVDELHEDIYEWKATIPGSTIPLKWKACIVLDIPGEVISWKSLPDSQVENSGKIEFRKLDEDITDLRVNITYKPPMGLVGGVVSEFFHEKLEKEVREDILSFKSFAENHLMKPERV